jgi:hypothetical protein
MRRKRIAAIVFAPFGIALFVFLGGELVKQLWNWLLPPLFGFRQVTFWQAWGLLALCRILFGGFGFHGGDRSSIRGRIAGRVAERMEHMTPEERERFRQGMRGRCGFGPSTGGSTV